MTVAEEKTDLEVGYVAVKIDGIERTCRVICNMNGETRLDRTVPLEASKTPTQSLVDCVRSLADGLEDMGG